MRYTRFAITNFKGIRHLELNLDDAPQGRIITLVGLNESGKTTILDAVDYLQLGIADSDPLDLLDFERDDEHALIPIGDRGNFNKPITISARVELDATDKAMLENHLAEHGFRAEHIDDYFEVTDTYEFKDSVFQKRRGVWQFNPVGKYKGARRETRLNSDHAKWDETVGFLRSRMPSIWYFPNFLFDFPRRIYLDEKNPEDSRERFYRNLVQTILSSVDHEATIERHIAQRISSESAHEKTALTQLLLTLGRKVASDVFESWDEIFNLPAQAKRAAFKEGADESNRRYLELYIEDSNSLYYVDERSLGFKWFFVFYLVAKYKALNSQRIGFLFDEPASNLHASAQAKLLECLEKLAENSTIIYTTHSHHMINPKWLENTYIVRNAGFDFDTAVAAYTARQTNITIERYRSFVSNHPDQTRYFQRILDVLDYKPSQLEMVSDMVMVEGKNDFYTFAYMKGIIIGKNSGDASVVPGGGAGTLDSIIRLYLGWAKNFVVLLDSDSEGEKQKERYLEMFGPIISNRIYTLGDLCPELKGKSLEKAFAQDELQAIVNAIEPDGTYTKKQFNRCI